MKHRICLAARLPGEPQQAYEGRYEWVIPPAGAESMTPGQLAASLPGCDGLVCLLSHRIDEALLASAPRLRVVSNYAVGYNNIDLAACAQRAITVTNTPGVLTETTADLAFALLLSTARRIVAADDHVRRGQFSGWGPSLFLGYDLYGKTLGIIGFGRIGQAVARRAAGFSMRVLTYSRRNEPVAGIAHSPVSLDELLEQSDFISLHCPLSPDTTHLIGRAELARMKPTAIVVNTARGPVVDEAALAQALAEGRLAGCGLDVYEEEPRIHPLLLTQPNVVLLPHIGSASIETRHEMARIALQAADDVLSGRRPRFVVNELLSR